ncbi:hypothetical protein [Salirhabdus sp. Marseille-P4669]|uniref:hypothetical protein n=1 Tax=Salirhabdus sp. Marseille-P4669 TaxID=2042310 RepID=UPI00190E9D56|nr:hypothetical protein [Salirhabdus sp. Marseille-P4669]
MKYYYNPEVERLLINVTKDTEKMRYNDNKKKLKVPKIGPRPPYYKDPKYDHYYPVI